MSGQVQREKVVLRCRKCGRRMKVPSLPGKTLIVKCPSGCGRFLFKCTAPSAQSGVRRGPFPVLLMVMGALLLCLPVITVLCASTSLRQARITHDRKVRDLESDLARQRERLKERYDQEVAATDPVELRQKAQAHYAAIWKERSSYSPQYALSVRERALLEMQAIARGGTRTQKEIVSSIALKAAPKNSRVTVTDTASGFRLDVDFDMCELTWGEIGSRTKHRTVPSLKKEVITLVSQVSDDVFHFCRDLGLVAISIGCRHVVNGYADGSYVGKTNITVYKVTLDVGTIASLEHDPYLGTYSVADRLRVELDEFQTLTITKERE